MTKKKKSYTKELKESVLKRLEHPTNDTVPNLAKELGIPKTTIYQWVRKKNKKSNNKNARKWTSQDKFQAVLETSSLTEREVAEYCRRKGIYVNQINSWKEQCLKANKSNLEDPEKLRKKNMLRSPNKIFPVPFLVTAPKSNRLKIRAI